MKKVTIGILIILAALLLMGQMCVYPTTTDECDPECAEGYTCNEGVCESEDEYVLECANVELATSATLADYPNMFDDGSGNYNGILVVGAHAGAENIIAITNIAASIQSALSEAISVDATKLDDEVSNIEDYNIIAVGNPCDNSVVREILCVDTSIDNVCEYTPTYSGDFNGITVPSGFAYIGLFESSSRHYQLIVSSQDDMDRRYAGEILANFGDYSFSGTQMVATTVSPSSFAVTEYCGTEPCP